MPNYAQLERADLCDLLLEVGPDAPTLCDGWQTADLAAHLVIRERRPDAGPGLLIAALAGYTNAVQRKVREKNSWAELVNLVRSGPPFPLSIASIDERMNTGEYFIHHEDVRRAQPGWQPRTLPPALEESLWSGMSFMTRLLLKSAQSGVVLDAGDYGHYEVKKGEPEVKVVGLPSELLLFSFGRLEAARVSFEGDPGAVSQLKEARFGL